MIRDRHVHRAVVGALCVAGCGQTARPPAATPATAAPATAAPTAAAPTAAAPTAPAPDPTPPDLRLPALARPRHYAADLTLDPSKEDFAGAITIDLDVLTKTRLVWLNADEITVDAATLTVGGERLAARTFVADKSYLAVILPREVAPGAATLALTYHGKMHRDDGDGIYTVKEGDDLYAFTQFENTDARQAFPCFDEPSYKVPWQLTLHTRKELTALANTPVASETAEAGGMKATRFDETKPLPSYLVAFAVGPFDAVDAGKTREGAPIRIITPRGRGVDTAWAAASTAPLLELLEQYFGSPYPYAKLDLVAVPVFNAGAMENPGLITFREELLVTRAADETVRREKAFAVTAAHEMAHQWFGDYVTMAWWDDTWLNESFASWMEAKIVAQWKPEWELDVDQVRSRSGVMRQDALDSARAIRQPIATADDIANAFDGITYEKGEAVLTMIERWVGAETFQKGVRAYLAAHAFGNATYDDFVGAMSTAAGRDLHPVFDAFVLQSGVPSLTVGLTCAKGARPSLHLEQHRYKPIGSQITEARSWQIPVCVRWGAGAATGRDCTVVGDAAGELALSADRCPDWVLPDEAELGYYRVKPTGDLLDRLLAHSKELTVAERVGLLGDVNALIDSGDAPYGVALALVSTLAKDKSRHLVDASIGIVAGIDELVSAKRRPAYQRFIRALYGARAKELGLVGKPGEDDDTKQLRPGLINLVADIGEEPALVKEATKLAWAWLDDHKAVPPEMVGTVLGVAARHGDARLFERLYADAKKASDREERGRLLGAMGSFGDPALVARAGAIALTDEFELRDSLGLLQGGMADPRTRDLAFAWFQQHFDEVEAKLPLLYRPYMAFAIVPICDEARKPELEKFFRPRIEKLEGGPRAMAQALEQLSLCAAQRKAHAPEVDKFLARQ